MKLAPYLALLLGACGARQPREVELVRGHEVVTTVEVRLPADPYTPTARSLPILYDVAGRICGRRYVIEQRHFDRTVETEPRYEPELHVMAPRVVLSWEIVATIKCLRE